MCVCVLTYYTHTHTCMHACIHIRTCIHIHAYIHTFVHTYRHAYITTPSYTDAPVDWAQAVAALAPGAAYYRIEPPASGVSMIESDADKMQRMEEATRSHFRSSATARELCRKLVKRTHLVCYPFYAFSNWSRSVHYRASSLVLACPLGLLPRLLPVRTSRSLSSMSPPRGPLVVLPRPVLVLL